MQCHEMLHHPAREKTHGCVIILAIDLLDVPMEQGAVLLKSDLSHATVERRAVAKCCQCAARVLVVTIGIVSMHRALDENNRIIVEHGDLCMEMVPARRDCR